MVSTTQLVALLVAPFAVLACEGECIVNITQQYLRLYSTPILEAFQDLGYQIDSKIIPSENRRRNSVTYFTPVFKAFGKVSYDGLEHAIFPSHFHGKCLYPNGTVPRGCPNPNCPVVCGTPGSMVHFFPDLTRIVFNQIVGQLANITSPGTKAYHQVQTAVLLDAQRKQRRALSRVTRSTQLEARGTAALEKKFHAIMKRFTATMRRVCGGSSLSKCKWETYMKQYILQFP